MTMTESVIEQAALAWLKNVGWSVHHGAEIAPGELAAERRDYAQVILQDRLRQALARLNPSLPAGALEDAFRRLTRPESATLEARNRALHRLLTDGAPSSTSSPPCATHCYQLRSGQIRVQAAEKAVSEAV